MSVEQAIRLYEDFHQRKPSKIGQIDLQWPSKARGFGYYHRSLITSYHSDKWDVLENYFHEHHAPFPVVLEPYKKGMIRYRYLARPKALTLLGEPLDIQFDTDPLTFQDFAGDRRAYRIAADPTRNLLVIFDRQGRVMVLTSPILRVTERGIEN